MKAMRRALRLTRAGRLDDAVRVIQDRLIGKNSAPTRPTTKPLTYPKTSSKPAVAPDRPGRFVEHRHTSVTGYLDYSLYLPPDLRPGLPLIVMLHGCSQSPEDFARGTGMNLLAEKAGVIVAYPRQSATANAQKCWNWFRSADQRRDDGEMALIAGVVRDIVRDHHVDPSRIYVAGLSAGGAAAANLAACYPDVFAAVAVHSGLAHGAARNLTTALSAMRQGSLDTANAAQQFVPTMTFHGERDSTVNPINSDQLVAAATSAYYGPLVTSIEEGRKSGGHPYKRAISRDAAGNAVIEQWTVAGAGHAWSGGNTAGSYTDPAGPDASQEMLRFFLQHKRVQ